MADMSWNSVSYCWKECTQVPHLADTFGNIYFGIFTHGCLKINLSS